MALHLLKLCVGVESLADLRQWQAGKLAERLAEGAALELLHRTIQTPRRREALLAGGSLYWVIKGVILARQPILDLRADSKADGRPCCAIVLGPNVIPTRPQKRRAFQGWRYLETADAPADARFGSSDETAIPREMAEDLRELCLIEG